jgi:hypothetical protein
MPDDYGRKNYSDRQYRDWIARKTAKSVWNQVLESNPGVGEFSRFSRPTSLGRSVQRYIQQSEFKKPYDGNDFVNMEGEWEGPGNGISYRPGGYDNPFNLVNPAPIIDSEPTRTVFDAESRSQWCAGSTKNIEITGTWPINELTLTNFTGSTSLSNIVGYGTKVVTASLTADPEQQGFITIEASMIATGFQQVGNNVIFKKIPGDSNVNLFDSSSCCEVYERIGVGVHYGSLSSISWADAWGPAMGWGQIDFLRNPIHRIHHYSDYSGEAPPDPDERWSCSRSVIVVGGVGFQRPNIKSASLRVGMTSYSEGTYHLHNTINNVDNEGLSYWQDASKSNDFGGVDLATPVFHVFEGGPFFFEFNEAGLNYLRSISLSEGGNGNASFFIRRADYDIPNVSPATDEGVAWEIDAGAGSNTKIIIECELDDEPI